MGLDKMLYKTDGNTAVTNDGAKIVSELLVKHPIAKMLVSMCQSQEEACGDGVTTTMLSLRRPASGGPDSLEEGAPPSHDY